MTGLIHLVLGPFYADILRDRRDPNIWIYVVQREGSADILAMGTCTSEQLARDISTARMRDLSAAAATAG